jgi:hypothetical protein
MTPMADSSRPLAVTIAEQASIANCAEGAAAMQAKFAARTVSEPEPAPTASVMPTRDEVHQAVLHEDRRAALAPNPSLRLRIQSDGKTTAALIRENAEREAAALAAFTEAVAELLGCPALVSDAGRNRLRGAFSDVRAMARHFGATGEVAKRHAGQTRPTRDASGRFV